MTVKGISMCEWRVAVLTLRLNTTWVGHHTREAARGADRECGRRPCWFWVYLLYQGLPILEWLHDPDHAGSHLIVYQVFEPEDDLLFSFWIVPSGNLNYTVQIHLALRPWDTRYLLYDKLAIFQLVFHLTHAWFQLYTKYFFKPKDNLLLSFRVIAGSQLENKWVEMIIIMHNCDMGMQSPLDPIVPEATFMHV